jgi:hypothetical protein
MNRNDDFDTTLEAWLHRQAPPQAPDRVLDAALERVAAQSQKRNWLHRLIGETPVSTFSRTTGFIAVVVLAAVIGYQFNELTGGVGGSPLPTVTTTPSSSHAPSANATPTLPVGCRAEPSLTDLSNYVWPESDALACWRDSALSFNAERIAGIVDCFSRVVPDWLACPQVLLYEVGDTGKVGVAQLIVAIDPARDLAWPMNTAVRVTGHFDDPAAQTCRQAEGPTLGTPQPEADTIESCRRTFVVTQVSVLPLGD